MPSGGLPELRQRLVFKVASEWLKQVEDSAATRRTRLRVAGEVEALRPSLRGLQLAESWYIDMIARIGIEDYDAACKAAREVDRLHSDPQKLRPARALTSDKNACP